MPKFDAATVVDPLDFTFKPHVNAEGTIREPSDDQIQKFLDAYKELTRELRGQIPEDIDPTDIMAMMDAMDNLPPDILVESSTKMAEICSKLCSGFPSVEQILALPPRIRNPFYAWLQGEVLNPEAATGGGEQPLNGQKR